MAMEDKGMRSGALKKRYLLVEARSEEAKSVVKELISKLKLRSDAEEEFVWKLASVSHCRVGGAKDTE